MPPDYREKNTMNLQLVTPRRPRGKVPFKIDDMLKRIADAVSNYPPAMLFDLYLRGYRSPFEILIACMISQRTLDEVSLAVSLNLFELARTPLQISQLSQKELEEILEPAMYASQKAERILKIATLVDRTYAGQLPCRESFLHSLPGVGPKTANLVLGICCGLPHIGVDVHVHRVTNRWGYVHAASEIETEKQLKKKLPKHFWVEINALLVPFGKHICTRLRPHCSTCPVLKYCRQVGVVNPR
jgi:endonuclease III